MKQTILLWPLAALLGLALSIQAQLAPKTNSTQAEALELLRRTIREQQDNPNKIIRTFTNPAVSTVTGTPSPRITLERQYLDGQLTAKQYQKALAQLEKDEKLLATETARRARSATATPATSFTNGAAAPAQSALTNRTAPPRGAEAPTNSSPAVAPATAQPTPRQKEISDVEARIDEMLRLKAEREKAATNSIASQTNNTPTGPQTKRQRLDDLLKQYVAGSVTDADYKVRREKILSEPN